MQIYTCVVVIFSTVRLYLFLFIFGVWKIYRSFFFFLLTQTIERGRDISLRVFRLKIQMIFLELSFCVYSAMCKLCYVFKRETNFIFENHRKYFIAFLRKHGYMSKRLETPENVSLSSSIYCQVVYFLPMVFHFMYRIRREKKNCVDSRICSHQIIIVNNWIDIKKNTYFKLCWNHSDFFSSLSFPSFHKHISESRQGYGCDDKQRRWTFSGTDSNEHSQKST